MKELPKNFADNLFHLEMEIENDPIDINIIN